MAYKCFYSEVTRKPAKDIYMYCNKIAMENRGVVLIVVLVVASAIVLSYFGEETGYADKTTGEYSMTQAFIPDCTCDSDVSCEKKEVCNKRNCKAGEFKTGICEKSNKPHCECRYDSDCLKNYYCKNGVDCSYGTTASEWWKENIDGVCKLKDKAISIY